MIAICGGGNAGHALAIVLSQHGPGEVRWLVRSDSTARQIQAGIDGDGLCSTGVIAGHATKLRRVSTDPAEIIPDADVVLIAAPAFAHADILACIAPHLSASALLGSLPARGGFEFDVVKMIAGLEPGGHRHVFGLQTLPWATRIVERGRTVHFRARKAKVLMAALPAGEAPAIAMKASTILGVPLEPTQTFLDMTLGNPGQSLHPGLMYGHFASWAGQSFEPEEVPLFYAGATDAMADQVLQMSDEAVTVARAIEERSDGRLDLRGSIGILDWLRQSYGSETADTSTVVSCFRTGPLHASRAPVVADASGRSVPDFGYRYLSEDVPYGLVVTKAMAELVDVATPAIDRVIVWAQSLLRQRYVTDGRIDRSGTRGLPIPQHHGVETGDELTRWYLDR